MSVRTRVAPSPTGDPHLGTAYTALFNRAFAHKNGGQFILRIEDTDQQRSDPQAETAIIDALSWLGLDWDEGPNVGGDRGPYKSSERIQIYQEYIRKLCAKDGAFHCFCSKQRLDEVRTSQIREGQTPKYDGHCLNLDNEEVNRRIGNNESYVIRLKVPEEGECTFIDALRGAITIPWSQVDMQVLIKSDGFPTYHFAASVDDHLMGITHIFRGEEWLSSCPKHKLIYDYFGWEMPKLYHLPLLRNRDQSKMSKRKQATSINYYRRRGFLPEVLLNYLATMGWSMPDEQEKFSMQEFQENFDPDRLSTSGPIFDVEKLSWLNGNYIRDLSSEEFKSRLMDWAFGDQRDVYLLKLVQERTERFDDIATQMDYLLGDRTELSGESFNHKTLTHDQCKKILDFSIRCLDDLTVWDRDAIYNEIKQLASALELKIRDVLFPLFIAISGKPVSLPLFDSLVLLEKDISRARMRTAIQALGGISKKQRKRLDEEWRTLNFANNK